jgi:hypothetical protein
MLIRTTTVLFDLAGMHVLWILWMATAILLIQFGYKWDIPALCTPSQLAGQIITPYCPLFLAMQNSIITIFVIALVYVILLLSLALIYQARGKNIWRKTFRTLNLPEHDASGTAQNTNVMSVAPTQMPIQLGYSTSAHFTMAPQAASQNPDITLSFTVPTDQILLDNPDLIEAQSQVINEFLG